MEEQGSSFALLNALDQTLDDVTIVGEYENDIFKVARASKGSDEIERMRRVGLATSTVMRDTIDFVRGHSVNPTEDDSEPQQLVKEFGTPLTIADVKRYVRSRLLSHGLEDSEGMIFSIGHDAGVPHSRGEADTPLCLGKTIVFDLFPRETGGGYFHDVTRTFCVGHAPLDVRGAYNDVKECFDQVVAALKPGVPTHHFEEMACDIFEKRGHNTHRTDRTLPVGYVHSLGHGVGLKLHERPSINLSQANRDRLLPGSVVTVEPGLYYPDRGFGVRIEDTLYLDEDGQVHSLTNVAKELVVEL
jgi:Xaa-Pro aminopeptidase